MSTVTPRWGRPLRYHTRRIWVIPTLWVLFALLLGIIIPRLEYVFLLPANLPDLNGGTEVSYLSAIASGMMALTAIVFSLAFVFVQFGSSAYSPRLVSLFTTDWVMTNSLGVFTGTFLFALVGLVVLTPDRSTEVSWVIGVTSLGWLIASIALFILLVQRINRLTIAHVLHTVGEAGRRVVESMYPLRATDEGTPGETPKRATPIAREALPPVTQTLHYFGGPAVVVELHIRLLTEVARVEDVVLEIQYAVGDVVADGSKVLTVRGGKKEISETALRRCIVLGFERTIEQDPKYALRLLVDVGIKALSPAVNDPTTAVMALNEIDDLLGRIGRRQLDVGYAYDSAGKLRLLYPTATWEDFLSLAIDEIRFYGANSYQVMRRLRAMLLDLMAVVPPDRVAAIKHQVVRMEASVGRNFTDEFDLLEAQQTDRQGIGLSRVEQ